MNAEDNEGGGDGILAGLVSISASYRLTQHWLARVTWNRVMTRYSRDTDVILGGVCYRFLAGRMQAPRHHDEAAALRQSDIHAPAFAAR